MDDRFNVYSVYDGFNGNDISVFEGTFQTYEKAQKFIDGTPFSAGYKFEIRMEKKTKIYLQAYFSISDTSLQACGILRVLHQDEKGYFVKFQNKKVYGDIKNNYLFPFSRVIKRRKKS